MPELARLTRKLKLAAVHAIANLAKQEVTDEVMEVYKGDSAKLVWTILFPSLLMRHPTPWPQQ